MQNDKTLTVLPPSLPKGGGSMQGMGETLTMGGPMGASTLTVPFPITSSRGYAPQLALSYSSLSGTGIFGRGWQALAPSIRLRTSHGVPRYAKEDTFLSPDGEILRIALNAQGKEDTRVTRSLQGVTLPASWRVTRYQPRIVQDFSRFEYWQPDTGNTDLPFWVVFSPSGEVSIWGKTDLARIANPADKSQIAEWCLEESVTPTGEHIAYQYRAENDAQCDADEKKQHPLSSAQRYLAQINYGNIKPQASLFALDKTSPAENQWLFHLVLDYGERGVTLNQPPAYAASQPDGWLLRSDSFSRFDYGFEVRTRRLCRQVLMFHRLEALAGRTVANEKPALIARQLFTYALNADAATLNGIQAVAYDEAGAVQTMPPLSFTYQPAEEGGWSGWQPMPILEKYNLLQPYQIVDLYGEGIPGILYQDVPGAWWYRAPQRGAGESITYDALAPLPTMPSQQDAGMLIDINGDGKLDWLVTSAGVNGFHSFSSDGQWSPFIPVSALPIEYFHPQAQLADISGAGLPDLAMIGPNSVRVYANQRTGWQAAENVAQKDGIRLPLAGNNERALVAFADILGSGQQHLVEITSSSVRCWPNLGHGKFGSPITLPGFSVPDAEFNPEQIWLADTDGSGALDIIYAHRTSLSLYINESGNRFTYPQTIALPDKVTFDRTCQLHIADTQGLGVPSIILTVPHMSPAHWHLELEGNTPLLLHDVDNHRGTKTTLKYRSSAQFWLDEKQQARDAGQELACHLPFAMQLVRRREVLDEITGNKLSSVQTYARGVWDGKEREFRGFARVSVKDTDTLAQATGSDNIAVPSRQVSWFATGVRAVDDTLPAEYWSGDTRAWPHFTPRFSQYDAKQLKDVAVTLTDENQDEMYRAMKGLPLRNEVYGEDGTPAAAIPYAVSEYRVQVRQLNNMVGGGALASTLESRDYSYERVISDPQCHQTITLASDEWGNTTDSVSVAYPRRAKPATSPYPSTLPDTLFASSYDEQQRVLRLTHQRQTWYNWTQDEAHFLPGIPLVVRDDSWEHSAEKVPSGGITLESLITGGLLTGSAQYLGHQQFYWKGGNTKPSWPLLSDYTEQAMLGDAELAAFDGIMTASELTAQLTQAGYISVTRPLALTSESKVWVALKGFTDYGSASQFYRPLQQRDTKLTGKTSITWDTHYCAVTDIQDAAGAKTHADYDYRFLTPNHIIDPNDNHQAVTLDVWGRPTSSRFWGTENGAAQGYTQPSAEKVPFTVPATVEEALAITNPIPVAQCLVYCDSSWMAAESSRMPPHTLVITTDRYDTDKQQQRRQTISFSDGFGRELQTAVRFAPGESWQRKSDGSLVTGSDGKPAVANTDTRWSVSGRGEYDGKGQLIRRYQPFFLNSWLYLSDDSARHDLYADTHYFDAIGREYQVKTAKGDFRRTLFTPWFTVAEDENDTVTQ
ncbi:SpvB/TcaC N-terminal domain-containing protein [Cedecea neteri]|uniref:Virulence protein n=1 Tax=Cedecea neteri TaxID=158822 RepID=A0A291DTN8_9ENTR|nr:SpvB/TcaC N-terminal domain-containing protein [Cedecea neteri]ATF91151.1 virulence protein [Cedecea neteri]